MPLALLRCRSARFDDGRLNQKVKIATLKNKSRVPEGMYNVDRNDVITGLSAMVQWVTEEVPSVPNLLNLD